MKPRLPGMLAGAAWLAVVVATAGAPMHGQERQTPAPPGPEWTRAAPGRPIVLPADHASHPEYKLEWWYYTGNLDAADGRRFGYQMTFFRVGVDAQPANPSRWAVRD
ncbi:MAG: lipocalin-like domain-containing protein, partial [Vicinamibacterales bacterium]